MAPAQLRILVVDDEPAHAVAIQRAFSKADMNVRIDVAGSIAEYWNCIAERTPDIALVDLHLPDGTALDLLAEPGRFPVLVMTSKS